MLATHTCLKAIDAPQHRARLLPRTRVGIYRVVNEMEGSGQLSCRWLRKSAAVDRDEVRNTEELNSVKPLARRRPQEQAIQRDSAPFVH